ncbi:MAG TPA: BTAD domain-containing putative transcriptional regulator [Iamia sp.]
MTDEAGLGFTLLGGVGARRDGVDVALGGAKPRALLGLLLLDPGRVVPLDRIVDAVWAGQPPAQAEVSVRGYVSKLRRALEPEGDGSVLPWRDGGYLVAASPETVDLHRFEAAVDAGLAALGAGRADEAHVLLIAAEAEWAGPPFGALADVLDVDAVVARLVARRAEATEALLRVRLARGEHVAALPDLAAAVAADPLREGVQALHALALYRAGRPVDALRAIETARRTLAEEVGVDPGPELRDLEARVLAHDPTLAWTPPPEPESGAGELLVGRDTEVARLLALHGGGGGAAVVGGGPGVGKTALVRRAAATLARDAVVARGRADADTVVPFGPWRGVARDLARHDVDLGLPVAGADATPDPADDPAGVRQRTHLAVVDALREGGRSVVVVLDDLQWADEASLALLGAVVDELDADLPVTILATVREPTPRTPALAAALDALARAPRSVRIALDGLSDDAVAEWVTDALGADAGAALAAEVAARTGGNPLFVREVLSLLADGRRDPSTALAAVPPAVGDVLRRRASGLAPTTQRIVSVASVVGREVDVGVLAAVLDAGEDLVLDALEEAVEAGLVVAEPGTTTLAFSHALVADALAAEVNAVRRARLHARIAEVMAPRVTDAAGAGLVAAAHHAWAGAGAGSATLAVDLCHRAAAAAFAEGAPAEAVVQLERAIDSARRTGRPTADLLVELGRARTGAGDIDGGREATVEAAAVAEAADDPLAMATALSEVNADDLWSSLDWTQHDPRVIALAERALDRLPASAGASRAALMAATASQLTYVDVARSEALSAEAVAVAEEVGDPLVLARVLVQRYWCTWRPSGIEARVAVADRLLALVAEGGLPPWFTPLAHLARFTTAYEVGDAARVTRHLAAARASADPRRTPSADSYVRYATVSVALLRGDLERAATAIADVHDGFRRTRAVSADGTAAGLTMLLHLLAGDTDAALATNDLFTGTVFEPSARWFRAWILAEAGRADEAVDRLEAFDGTLADDWYRLPLVTVALHAAGLARSVEQVERLLPLARPLSGLLACTGSGGIVVGPVDLALARAEHVRGDADTARRHLEAATAMAVGLDATPWVARAEALRAELDRAV